MLHYCHMTLLNAFFFLRVASSCSFENKTVILHFNVKMSSLLAVRSNNESRNRYENTVYITFGSFITQEMEHGRSSAGHCGVQYSIQHGCCILKFLVNVVAHPNITWNVSLHTAYIQYYIIEQV